MPDCPNDRCAETFGSMDRLVDHLTDEHDAFTKTLTGGATSDV